MKKSIINILFICNYVCANVVIDYSKSELPSREDMIAVLKLIKDSSGKSLYRNNFDFSRMSNRDIIRDYGIIQLGLDVQNNEVLRCVYSYGSKLNTEYPVSKEDFDDVVRTPYHKALFQALFGRSHTDPYLLFANKLY